MPNPLVKPHRAGLVVSALVVFLLPLAPELAGQAPQPEQPSRPFRGLFGRSEADSGSRNVLDLDFSLYGAYDDNDYLAPVIPITNLDNPSEIPIPVVNPLYPRTGFYSGGQAGLNYRRRGSRVLFQASGGSGYRYYPDQSSLNGATPWESLGLSGSLGRRTTFSLSQAAAYSPYYGFGVFPGLTSFYTPGQVFMSAADYALYSHSVITYTAGASLARRLSRRSSLSFAYQGRFVDLLSDPRSLLDQSVGARYSSGVTQDFGYHVGYTYRRGTYGSLSFAGRPIQSHDLDVGIDYNRALDRTRRTTFGLSTGTALVVSPTANRGYVLGSAFLNRSLGRTWNVRLDYRRGVQFVQGFDRPFFTDSVALAAHGYIARRVDMEAWAGYSTGELGLGGGEGFGTYTGTARVQFALSRYAALYTEGIYYHYLFDQGARPPGVPQGLDRSGIRGGVNFWLPLLR